MSDELKPCPFCGAFAAKSRSGSFAMCSNTECHMMDVGWLKIDAWNRRASDWRPIKTLKPETEALLWCKKWATKPLVGYYQSGVITGWRIAGIMMENESLYPTLWQPLPEAPEE